MIKKIEVESFRGLRNVEASNFSRVNLFVGENGIGKTSMLEAIVCNGNWGHQSVYQHLSTLRNIEAQTVHAIRSYFYKFETNQRVHSKIYLGNENCSRESIIKEGVPSLHGEDQWEFIYKNSKSKSICNIYSELVPKCSIPNISTVANDFSCIYIKPNQVNYRKIFSNIIRQSIEHGFIDIELIDILRYFDKKIKNLFISNNELYVTDNNGFDHLVQNFGSAFYWLLTILSYFAASGGKHGVFCIDGIECYLHHSRINDFWRCILMLLDMYPRVQLFASTYSESLVVKSLNAFQEHQDYLRVYRFLRGEKEDIIIREGNYDTIKSLFHGLIHQT